MKSSKFLHLSGIIVAAIAFYSAHSHAQCREDFRMNVGGNAFKPYQSPTMSQGVSMAYQDGSAIANSLQADPSNGNNWLGVDFQVANTTNLLGDSRQYDLDKILINVRNGNVSNAGGAMSCSAYRFSQNSDGTWSYYWTTKSTYYTGALTTALDLPISAIAGGGAYGAAQYLNTSVQCILPPKTTTWKSEVLSIYVHGHAYKYLTSGC